MKKLYEKINNKKLLLIIIASLLIIIIFIGISYAVWLLTRTQTDQNLVETGCFDITFVEDTNGIELRDTYPITDEEGKQLAPYTFTITNICDIAAGYQVNLEMLDTTTLDFSLLKTAIDTNLPTILNTNTLVEETIVDATSYTLLTGTLEKNQTATHDIRLWIDISATLENSQNKLVESKIVIVTTPTVVIEESPIEVCVEDYSTRGITPTDINNLSYTENADGIIITGYDLKGGGNLIIPCEINDKPIVQIGEGVALTYDAPLTDLTLSSTVTTISEMAFYNHDITTLVFPNSITSIGSYSFAFNKITSLSIPGSLKNIGSGSFFMSQLSTLTISEGVETIGSDAFSHNNLTAITIPGSVTTIGDYAFAGNRIPTNQQVPSTVVNVGIGIFDIASGNAP